MKDAAKKRRDGKDVVKGKAAKAAVPEPEPAEPTSDGELPEGDERGGREPVIQRYKGLGEMNAGQLWDTTLNPATRTLIKVGLKDAELADQTFDELMGSEVEGRKHWIAANAHKAELDV